MSLLRPGTLKAASEYDDPGSRRIAFAGFLDEFYLDRDRESRLARIAEEPRLVDDAKTNAYFGATAEHLCNRWRLGLPPDWTERPERFLSYPWYNCPDELRRFAYVETPSAFRRRFIFEEAEPLRRARTPRDGRWCAYEEMRTGMRWTDSEIESLPYVPA